MPDSIGDSVYYLDMPFRENPVKRSRMCRGCYKYICECWKRTHNCNTDWFLNFPEANTYLYSYHKLLNHIILETIVDEHDDHMTVQTLVPVEFQ